MCGPLGIGRQDVLEMLDELARLTTLAEGSPQSFRVRAYESARHGLEGDGRDPTQLSASELTAIRGVGKSTAAKIREFVDTGSVAKLDGLRAEFPPSVVELSRIPGMGPKTLRLIRQRLGVENVAQLKAAIDAEQLQTLPGMGAASEAKMAKAIERLGLASKDRRTPIAEALPIAQGLVDSLRTVDGVEDAVWCGSLRRFVETVGDIDITVASTHPELAMAAVRAHRAVADIVVSGPTKTSFLTTTGLQVDVRVVAPEAFGAATLYFTGSKAHNIALRQRAIDRGLLLNEYGLFTTGDGDSPGGPEDQDRSGNADDSDNQLDPNNPSGEVRRTSADGSDAVEQSSKPGQPEPGQPDPGHSTRGREAFGAPVASRTEADIYAALDLEFVPPTLREGSGEVEAAARGALPNLVSLEDIRGDLHYHTDRSGDGRSTLAEMVEVAAVRGYEYLAITDHGEDLAINGSNREEMLAHCDAIRALQPQYPHMTLLYGCELNIGPTGGLDYDADFRALFDYSVASVHSHFDLSQRDQTERLVAAIADPTVNAIGHLTGRYIGRRPGIELDIDIVLEALYTFDVALEINGALDRLDAESAVVRRAVDRGVKLVIDTDSHHVSDLVRMSYGVETSQRGWAPKELVVNTWPRDRFLAWVG
ncbi:MAG: PHP domain-containing protein [Actinobacteria bacterium]|nr:PHP domain-containing protein [Actinomycetota bacterium]